MNQYQKFYVKFLKKFLKPHPFGHCLGGASKLPPTLPLWRTSRASRPLKVVFDCSNGTSGPIVRGLTTNNQRLTTFIINQIPDGNFPAHSPNPLEKNAAKQLQKAVLKNRADLGVVFDEDGDRAVFVDDKGRIADPDAVASLLIWSLKPKKVVVNETTSLLIRKEKPGMGYKLIKSENGSYFIKKAIKKHNADFGCERSGHYYFKKFFNADSGILSAIEVINAVSNLPYKFSEFLDLSPKYYRSEDININFQFPRQRRGSPQAAISNFQRLLKIIEGKYKKTAVNISHIDGLRMDFKNGIASRSFDKGWWFNFQLSNTEQIARLNIEAENKETLVKEKEKLLSLLK